MDIVAHQFKIGDRVWTGIGEGKITDLDSAYNDFPYRVSFEYGVVWLGAHQVRCIPPADVKEAAFFAFDQPHDPELERRVEASGLAYMLLRRAERAEQQVAVQTERADRVTAQAYQSLELLSRAIDAAKQFQAQADQAERSLRDMRSANGKLIKIQHQLQRECDNLRERVSELDQGSSWLADKCQDLESYIAYHEAEEFQPVCRNASEARDALHVAKEELTMIGAALGVAERARKLAEYEAAQSKAAIVAWHLEAQRAQAETIRIGATLTELATAVVAALESDMDGEEPPHPAIAAVYSLAYRVTQGDAKAVNDAT